MVFHFRLQLLNGKSSFKTIFYSHQMMKTLSIALLLLDKRFVLICIVQLQNGKTLGLLVR